MDEKLPPKTPSRLAVNEFKANIGILSAKLVKRVRSNSISMTQAEIQIELVLRQVFNQGLLAACTTTDDIQLWDDIRRVSKLIKTDLLDEFVLGFEGEPLF